jgi:hypothetical protein
MCVRSVDDASTSSRAKALVLYPCSGDKTPSAPTIPTTLPLSGITGLREQLWQRIRATSGLAGRGVNQKGLLCTDSEESTACELYKGGSYLDLPADIWTGVPAELLIVSAAYGLLRPYERIRTYDLQMHEVLRQPESVYHFWQRAGLPVILRQYLADRQISHVWSLLPSGEEPYHEVFEDLWRNPGSPGPRCYHVQWSHATGIRQGRIRSTWLVTVTRRLPLMLIGESPLMAVLDELRGIEFNYGP